MLTEDAISFHTLVISLYNLGFRWMSSQLLLVFHVGIWPT
jgi:hypothetical protein